MWGGMNAEKTAGNYSVCFERAAAAQSQLQMLSAPTFVAPVVAVVLVDQLGTHGM